MARGNTAVHWTAACILLFHRRTSHPPMLTGLFWVWRILRIYLGSVVLLESLLEKFVPWTNFPNVDMTCNGTQSWQDTLYSSQNNVRNLQKQLFDQYGIMSLKGFYWQNKDRESCSALRVTMEKHFSTNQVSQVQAPLGILPYVADLTAHSMLLVQRTTHFSKVFSTLFWDSLKFDKTHQDTLNTMAHTSKSRASLSCKTPEESPLALWVFQVPLVHSTAHVLAGAVQTGFQSSQ